MNKQTRENKPVRPWFASLWIIGGALSFACVLSVLAAGMMWSTRPAPAALRAATAVLEVILAPTIEILPATPTPEITATTPGQPSESGAEITIGAFVQIGGTDGTGLRLRSKAGLDGEVLWIGLDSEVLRVDDGPVELDGYTWWYLVGPFDETRQGWAASTYLSVVQNPQ